MPEAGTSCGKHELANNRELNALHCAISAVLVIAISVPQSCFALDTGSKPAEKPVPFQMKARNADQDDPGELLRRADMLLHVYAPNRIDIGLGKRSEAGRSPILLQMADLEHFLQREPHKKLLVVLFEAPIVMAGRDCIQATQNELKGFLDRLGYKRVVIIGSFEAGSLIIDDEAHDEVKQLEPVSTINARRSDARFLSCENNLDRIDIGLGQIISRDSEHKLRSPIYLSRDDLSDFLRHDRHKDIIVVELGKAMHGELENQLRCFIDQLGYKRIVVEHSFGMFQTQPIVTQDAK